MWLNNEINEIAAKQALSFVYGSEVLDLDNVYHYHQTFMIYIVRFLYLVKPNSIILKMVNFKKFVILIIKFLLLMNCKNRQCLFLIVCLNHIKIP